MTYDQTRLLNLVAVLDDNLAAEIYRAAYVWANMAYEKGANDARVMMVGQWVRHNWEYRH